MTFQELIQKAVVVRKKYAQHEQNSYGKAWSTQDIMSGFVGDVGDLSKLIQAKNGMRTIDNVDTKLKHELADCLWSIIVLAQECDVDLESSFVETMEQIENKL